MRFLLFLPCLVFFAICVTALPPAQRGMPAFKHSIHAKNYEAPPRAMFEWQKKAQKWMQGAGNDSKVEPKMKLDALLLCQEKCTMIWSPAHSSSFWSDCNECCRKIGDSVAYC